MFHVVQLKVSGAVGAESRIQHWKKRAEEREDEVKKNEAVVEKLEKKREQYEGEVCENSASVEYAAALFSLKGGCGLNIRALFVIIKQTEINWAL